jgi:hypothetical protein
VGRPAQRAAGHRVAQHPFLAVVGLVPADRVLPERGELRPDRHARAQAELQPAAAEGVEHRRVLCQPQRVLERQRHDGGAELDPAGPRGRPGQQHQWRRQPAVLGAEVVLCHPAAVVAEFLGRDEQLDHRLVQLGGVGAVHVGEEAQVKGITSAVTGVCGGGVAERGHRARGRRGGLRKMTMDRTGLVRYAGRRANE